MELNTLTAISPIDGRYYEQVRHLDEYFSEYALIRYRVLVEAEYFLFLAEKKVISLPAKVKPAKLRAVYEEFTENAVNVSRFLYASPNANTRYKVVPLNVGVPAPMRGPGEATGGSQ